MPNFSYDLYRKYNELDEWQQGDIIEGLYIAKVIEDDLFIHRPPPGESAKVSVLTQLAKTNNKVAPPFSDNNQKEQALIPIYKTAVMIVSQTCDIINDRQLVVARVRPFKHMPKPEIQENIRCNNVMYAFYLPDYPVDGEESFCNINELTVISKDLLSNYKAHRKRSLSSKGLRQFQFFIERYFCREAMPEDIIKIISGFRRKLQETILWKKVNMVYYYYTGNQISLLVALNEEDDNTQTFIEDARNSVLDSTEHNYQVDVKYELIDNISLRDIKEFRYIR